MSVRVTRTVILIIMFVVVTTTNIKAKGETMMNINDSDQSKFKQIYEKRRLAGHEKHGHQYTTKLWDLVSQYHNKELLLPPHQRQLSWSGEKQLQYTETLFSEPIPPGSFETYQIELDNGRLSPAYLNDGCQRIITAWEMWQHALEFGIGQKDVEYVLKNTFYPVNHKYHKTHKDALERFQRVNSNWPLTSYQKTIGDIVYCEGDDRYLLWQTFVDDLHYEINNLLARSSIRYEPKQDASGYLEKLHQLYRHDLSMLFRFLVKDRHSRDYKTSSLISGSDLQSGDYFEKPLSWLLQKTGYEKALRQRKLLINHLIQEVALVDEMWSRVKSELGLGASAGILGTTLRWILDTSIWRRNNSVDYQQWSTFVYLALRESRGSTTVFYKKGDEVRPRRFNFTLSRMEAERLCAIKEWDVDIAPKKRIYRKRITIKPGFDFSHLRPFVINGEGDGNWEPGGLNRSRGAREWTQKAQL